MEVSGVRTQAHKERKARLRLRAETGLIFLKPVMVMTVPAYDIIGGNLP